MINIKTKTPPKPAKFGWFNKTLVYLLWSALGVTFLYSITKYLWQLQQSRAGPTATSLVTPAIVAVVPQNDDATTTLSLAAMRAAVKVLDPDVLEHSPPGDVDPKYKNPCWTAASGKLRCLPYFHLSTFSTGSGSLKRMLLKHPNIVMDAGDFPPWGDSWGYWSEYRNHMSAFLDSIQHEVPRMQEAPQANVVMDGSFSTFALYWAGSGKVHRAFASTAVACWAQCHGNYTHERDKYERCMDDICLPKGREADMQAAAQAGITYDDLQLPLLMRAVYGTFQPKFVLLVRDPVERMHSNYFGSKNMYEHHGNHSEGFLTFVREQVSAYRACTSRFSAWRCAMHFETLSMQQEKVFYHCDQLFRGMYAPYLRVWYQYMPRSAFLILKSEEYFADPQAALQRVLRFLDLPQPSDPAILSAMLAAGKPISHAGPHRPMLPEARSLLKEFYRPFNDELAGLLGDPSIRKWNEQ